MKFAENEIVFFVKNHVFCAGKIISVDNDESCTIMTYEGRQVNVKVHQSELRKDFDKALAEFKSNNPEIQPDVEGLIDLLQYLRLH